MSAGKASLKELFKKYIVDALSHMAMGLFCSLILGLIIGQIAKIPGLDFLNFIAEALSASSPLVGACIGLAIAYGLSCAPLVMISSAITGALGYQFGGPVGAYLAVIVGEELGGFVSRKTPVDIIITPLVTIVAGGLFAKYCCSPINDFMLYLGEVINKATMLSPFMMGIAVSVLVGCALTLPISSVAICVMLGIDGLAAGAATVGCCAQMVGFAVISYRDNGMGGLLSQGLGTSMLQIGNIEFIVGRFRKHIFLQVVTQDAHEHEAADQHDQQHRGQCAQGNFGGGEGSHPGAVENLHNPVRIPVLPGLPASPSSDILIFHSKNLRNGDGKGRQTRLHS